MVVTIVCAVCLPILLWFCDMAGLLRGTFVSWWYLPRIWPSVADIQHYYHARYPTDDWNPAYLFSLVYFSAEVYLVGTPGSYASGSRHPLRWLPPHEKTISNWSLSACIIGWLSRLPDNSISTSIAQFMWFVIGRIHYGLKVVFCFRRFTAFHYHHYARLLTDIEHINVCRVSCGSVSNMLLVLSITFIFITIYGVLCVQLAYFSIGDWNIYIAHVIVKSEVSIFPIVVIFFRGRVPVMLVISCSVTYCIYIPGKPGIGFHYYCAVHDECK